MKFFKFTVKIPNTEENKYDEYIFYTLNEVCKFLDINDNSVYKIMNGDYKYSHKNSMRLKGIVITREDIKSKEMKDELRQKYKKKERKKTIETEEEKQKKLKIKEEKAIKVAQEYQTLLRNKTTS